MTLQPRGVSLPGESISLGKDYFLFRRYGSRWNVTAGNGQFGTGNPEESLNSQTLFIRPIPSSTRCFSLSPGPSPTARSARTETQRFMCAFGETRKVNYTLSISKCGIHSSSVRTKGIWLTSSHHSTLQVGPVNLRRVARRLEDDSRYGNSEDAGWVQLVFV
jgi:hypothetical protein